MLAVLNVLVYFLRIAPFGSSVTLLCIFKKTFYILYVQWTPHCLGIFKFWPNVRLVYFENHIKYYIFESVCDKVNIGVCALN